MEEEQSLMDEITAEEYDASDRPFDFVEVDAETAFVCEHDESMREKISSALKNMGYQVTVASSTREALKGMRFHLFDVVIVNDAFDPPESGGNGVLAYLETLSMSTRRQIFVALVTDRHRSMDNMAAFNKSVNVVINPKNIEDVETILRGAVNANAAFYRVFRDALKKTGKI